MSRRHDTIGRLAWLMDKSIPLPGGYRIGLDGLLGLIPGVGDLLSGTVSGWIILQAHQAGAPKSVVARMAVNVLIDLVIGSIPVIGDLFDFVFKANTRNLALLEGYRTDPVGTQKKSVWQVAMVMLAVLVGAALLVWAVISLSALLWQRLAA